MFLFYLHVPKFPMAFGLRGVHFTLVERLTTQVDARVVNPVDILT